MTAFDGWENFYVIVGSSAGALIGLQFVVLALIAETPIAGRDAQAGAAFTTPSVVHFGVVLFLSAIVIAPWHGIGKVAIVWGLIGFGGMIYSIIVTRRLRVQTIYKPVFEDWLFHVLLQSPPTQRWLRPRAWLILTSARLFSLSPRRRCCCSSSAFTMPGTSSRITSLPRNGNNGKLSPPPSQRNKIWKSNEVARSHPTKDRLIGLPARCVLPAPSSHSSRAPEQRGIRIR